MIEQQFISADAFNARHLTPREVAEAFVPPPQFFDLLGMDHCLLVGPRGSGKTTLLKMLQVEAVCRWQKTVEGKNCPQCRFIGVFVPADVRWAKQLTAKTGSIDSASDRLALHETAFGNAVCLALLETFEQCIAHSTDTPSPFGQVHFDRNAESQLAIRLSELWGLKLEIPSLSGLKHALRICQNQLPRIALALTAGVPLSTLAQDHPFLTVGWLDALVSAVETIGEAVGKPTQRWALLIDELEIVPDDLLKTILEPLRSTSSNLIFKLALSPTGAGSSLLSSFQSKDPTLGNDFKTLRLWYSDRDQLRKFAGRLLTAALHRKGYLTVDENALQGTFGWSSAVESEETQSEAVLPLNKRKSLFIELLKKDSSFAEFLGQKQISPQKLNLSDDDVHGPLIRKITPLVVFRNHVLRHWRDGKAARRTAIGLQPYLGFPNLLDITEGNPRWVLNLADGLASESLARDQPLSAQSVQSRAVESFYRRFVSMLKVYPVGAVQAGQSSTLFSFLSTLAGSLDNRLYNAPFSSDPALSFTVDKVAAREYGTLIETCVHLGALVIINPDAADQTVLFPGGAGLEGARLRLCYRLAPEFFLPLRSTRPINLSSAVDTHQRDSKQDISKKPKPNKNSNQNGSDGAEPSSSQLKLL